MTRQISVVEKFMCWKVTFMRIKQNLFSASSSCTSLQKSNKELELFGVKHRLSYSFISFHIANCHHKCSYLFDKTTLQTNSNDISLKRYQIYPFPYSQRIRNKEIIVYSSLFLIQIRIRKWKLRTVLIVLKCLEQ